MDPDPRKPIETNTSDLPSASAQIQASAGITKNMDCTACIPMATDPPGPAGRDESYPAQTEDPAPQPIDLRATFSKIFTCAIAHALKKPTTDLAAQRDANRKLWADNKALHTLVRAARTCESENAALRAQLRALARDRNDLLARVENPGAMPAFRALRREFEKLQERYRVALREVEGLERELAAGARRKRAQSVSGGPRSGVGAENVDQGPPGTGRQAALQTLHDPSASVVLPTLPAAAKKASSALEATETWKIPLDEMFAALDASRDTLFSLDKPLGFAMDAGGKRRRLNGGSEAPVGRTLEAVAASMREGSHVLQVSKRGDDGWESDEDDGGLEDDEGTGYDVDEGTEHDEGSADGESDDGDVNDNDYQGEGEGSDPESVFAGGEDTSTLGSADISDAGSTQGCSMFESKVLGLFSEEDGDDDVFVCDLCWNRYEHDASAQPPKLFMQPSFADLETHCRVEHAQVYAHICNLGES